MEQGVKSKLVEYAQKYNVPSWVLSSLVEVESNFNPKANGDKQNGNYKSFGLLQLYTNGGQGNGYSREQLYDMDTNLKIGMPHIAKAYEQGANKGLQGYELLKYTAGHSGHPSHNGTFTTGYLPLLSKSYNNGDELQGAVAGGTTTSYQQASYVRWLKPQSGVDLSNVDKTLLGRLAKLAEDQKKTIVISSGYRSTEKQAQLYNLYKSGKGNLAAKPGTSNHEKGLAIDINGWAQNVPESTFKKYGLHKPVSSENWHIELYNSGASGIGAGGVAVGNGGKSGGSGASASWADIKDENPAVEIFKQIDTVSHLNKANAAEQILPPLYILNNGGGLATRVIFVILGIGLLFIGAIAVVNQNKEKIIDTMV